MTDDLDTLRPEVREAVAAIDKGNGVFVNGDDCEGGIAWATVRAELLQLARNDADARIALDCEHDWQAMRERAERAEAELAALKARIANSCRAYHSSFEHTLAPTTLYARAIGVPGEQTFALVLVEE